MAEEERESIATGESATFDFQEAFWDAINKLDPTSNLTSCEVVKIGARVGGFVGEQTMWVRVKRTPLV
jgi:hypothetical protein